MQEDGEIQGFFQELTAARAMNGSGGCGMNVRYLYMYLMVFWGLFLKYYILSIYFVDIFVVFKSFKCCWQY